MGGTDPCWDHDDPWHATLGKRGLDHNTIARPTCATTGEMVRLFLIQRETEKTPSQKKAISELNFKLLQFNALTLRNQHSNATQDEEQWPARIAHLDTLIATEDVSGSFFQETRTKGPMIRETPHHVCLVSGTDRGRYGCEISISKCINAKIGRVPTITASATIVKIAKPRYMFVSVCAQIIRCDFLVLHAPCKRHPRRHIVDFWDEVDQTVEAIRELGVSLVLGADANEALAGASSSVAGGHPLEKEGLLGERQRKFCEIQEPFLPATFAK